MIKKTSSRRLVPLIILIILLGFAFYSTSKNNHKALTETANVTEGYQTVNPKQRIGEKAATKPLSGEDDRLALQSKESADHSQAGTQKSTPLAGDKPGATSKTAAQSAMPHLVVGSAVGTAIVNDRFNAIGTGKALHSVSLTPRSDGILEELFVKAGAKVAVGDAVAKLDSDKEEISVEKATIQLHDAQLALTRIEKLRETNTASEVQVITAKLNLENAKLALQDADLALERRTVRSPINGVVGILSVDPGNYVTTSTPIVRIDDRSKILIDIWIAERFAPLVHIGDKVAATSIAHPGTVIAGRINAIDNMIDEKSRTLRARAEIDNGDDSLRAGMSFEVKLSFPGNTFLTVKPLAIQWSDSGAYVWQIIDHRVRRVPIAIVQRNTDSVLITGPLAANDLVAIQGLQNLQENSLVTIQNQTELETLYQQRQQRAAHQAKV